MYCKCKNDEGYYPDCKGPEICTDEDRDHCEKNDGICVDENFQATCICKDKNSKGIFPECEVTESTCGKECKGICKDGICTCPDGGRPPRCDCESNCNGICENGICLCQNGGIPPDCIILPPACKDINCHAGYCTEVNGKPICKCYKGTTCGPDEYCSISGECECFNGGNPPNCRPYCSKDCGKWAQCHKDENDREYCICNLGGKHPNCQKCRKTCEEDYTCAVDENGREECLCRATGQKKCPEKCRKRCPNGRCVKENNREICTCADGSRNYPDCDGPCALKECPNGKCEIVNGAAECVCFNGIGVYPSCDACQELNCEERDGICAKNTAGVYQCICKNGHHNFPNCKVEPCRCPPETTCVFAGNLNRTQWQRQRTWQWLLFLHDL